MCVSLPYTCTHMNTHTPPPKKKKRTQVIELDGDKKPRQGALLILMLSAERPRPLRKQVGILRLPHWP